MKVNSSNSKTFTLTLSTMTLGVLWFATALASERAHSTVDFHNSPPEWQTAICFPDDSSKTLVDRSGELLYHYVGGQREFATRLSLRVVTNAPWQHQDLHSPRVPIVRTKFSADGLEIEQEAFAVPNVEPDRVDMASGAPTGRKDLMLVHVRNTTASARALHPQLIIDTTLPFRINTEEQKLHVGEKEAITSSLHIAGLTSTSASQRTIELAEVVVAAGGFAKFWVQYAEAPNSLEAPCTVEQAVASRRRAIEYWEKAALPYGRIEVPDPNVQALVDSSIRNIWQAREIKKGLPAFQVGPTCYRGLWIVDGAFLLEAAAMLGAGKEARSGVAYELTYQRPDGSIHVMDNYSKENGIVLWTCVRHAQLTQDKAWLETLWPQLERIAEYIRALRGQTLTNASPLDDGLLPAGFPDGGIGGVIDEYTNPYWNLAGLHAFIQAAHWLGKRDTAATWQKEYDAFMDAFHRASQRDLRTDSSGHRYLPARMDGQDLPQRGQWAFCQAVYPGQIFARSDPLVANMLAMLQNTEREGMVYGTGWDATGIWNYFASFYGHALLWQGNGRKAAQVLTAFANHAAPTLIWREEQSLQGQPFKKVGDMPHNWASAEFIRLVVHLLALDRGSELHLLEGLPPSWTGAGMLTRLNGIATPFGPLNMRLQVDRQAGLATLTLKPLAANCTAVVVHLPQGGTKRISPTRGGTIKFPLAGVANTPS
ncbi:MAG TPA: hypothetical protein VL361_23505 [Candidatus Limnocylindrales bacterium]|nr:hypothetical protein [Candidatus Limnocylindrales bacterium]